MPVIAESHSAFHDSPILCFWANSTARRYATGSFSFVITEEGFSSLSSRLEIATLPPRLPIRCLLREERPDFDEASTASGAALEAASIARAFHSMDKRAHAFGF